MKKMRISLVGLSLLVLKTAIQSSAALAQEGVSTAQPEMKQTETIQTPIEMAPGVTAPKGQPPMAEGAVSKLTLDESVSLALRVSTSILKAQNDREMNGTLLLQGYAQFLPNLGGVGNYTYQKGTNYFTQSVPTLVNSIGTGAGYSVSSTLNIFNGLSDISNLKSALLKKDASDLSLFRAKQAVVLDSTQSFLQVVLDNQLVRIARKNLSQSQERQRLLEEQTKVGVRNLSDLFRQQAQTSSDELYLINSLNKERTDQLLLLRKLRLDVAKNYQIVEPVIGEGKPDLKFEDESQMLQTALEQRTDLKASVNAAEAGEWDVGNVRGAYYPRLDLGAGLFSSGRILQQQLVNGVGVTPVSQSDLLSQLNNQSYYTVGLALTFNLFDRWTTKLAVAKARNISDNLAIDLQDRRLQVQGEVRQAYGDYQASIQQLESSKKGVEAAQKAYEVTQGRYEVGAASFVDLITAQTSLVQSEASRAQALIGFLLQGKVMEFAQGLTKVD